MIDTRYRFKKNDQMLYRELEDGPALIDPYRRVLIKLDPVALEIWQLLDGERSALNIAEILQDRFEVDRKRLEKDVVELLNDLFRREMIT